LVKGREAGALVGFVTVAFRPGHPEVNADNRTFSNFAREGRLIEGTPETALHPDLPMVEGDVALVKRRISAFTGTELDLIVRAHQVTTLVVAGVATGGAVASTVLAGIDRDLRVVVLRDACADPDPEVHAVLLERLFPRNAEVTTVDEWQPSIVS
jgi:nicotinamidase-related amidase